MIHLDLNIQHPCKGAILSQLGIGEAVLVPRLPQYPGQQCYWNVEKHIALNGGRQAFGWMLVEVPSIFLMAWHHGIWQSPNGQCLDISEHPVTKTFPGTTTFAFDPVQHYDLTWPPGMPQVFAPLSNHPTVEAFIRKYEDLHSLQRAKQDELMTVTGAFYDVDTGLTNGPSVEMTRLNNKYDVLITVANQERAQLAQTLELLQRAHLST